MASGTGRLRGKEWEAAADAAGYEEFDPLNRVNLGRSLETALLSRPLTALAWVPPFWGSGIYAIYFRGSDSPGLYGRLAQSPSPIYVGRAVPRGARKGLVEVEEGRRSRSLWARLDEHRESIEEARDLDIQDFRCRWLVADMLFVPMAERLIIQTYRPLWNVLIDGFGNHDPGSGRYDQERSPWDTLHEGRSWAPRLAAPPYTAADLRDRVAAHLDAYPPESAPALPPLIDTPVIEAAPAEDENQLW
jgi:Eco29kI-like restriction endonuclease